MTTQLAPTETKATQVERVVIENDLSKMSAEERIAYYINVCESLDLVWQTRPFAYLQLNGKLTLYATRDCTDQLRSRRSVSIVSLERERMDDLYVVTASATTPDGRRDSAIGAVPIAGLKGEALANAFMKAETKAKRRVTLSICGLGMTDESETTSIPDAVIVDMDPLDSEFAAPRALPRRSERTAEQDARVARGWTLMQLEAHQLGIEVPDLDMTLSNAEIKALRDEWQAKMAEAATVEMVPA